MAIKNPSRLVEEQSWEFTFTDSENTVGRLQTPERSVLLVSPFEKTHPHPQVQESRENVDSTLVGWLPLRPSHLSRVHQELAEASEMTKWPDDWDGEGAKRIDEDTFFAARNLAEAIGTRLDRSPRFTEGDLQISPGADGSVSLHWFTSSRELLIVVHEGGVLGEFYGDDRAGDETVKGTAKLAPPPDWIACWLAQ